MHEFKQAKSNHPLYSTWYMLFQRCYNNRRRDYKYYGGKGVTVCPEWHDNFYQFVEDVGERPPGYTLDRIDSTKGYSKDNCRWSPSNIQRYNTKKRISGKSKYKGVSIKGNKFVARISYKFKTYRLGLFSNEEEAALAYNKAALDFYGSYAVLNDVK